jgi:hypothetical protein
MKFLTLDGLTITPNPKIRKMRKTGIVTALREREE